MVISRFLENWRLLITRFLAKNRQDEIDRGFRESRGCGEGVREEKVIKAITGTEWRRRGIALQMDARTRVASKWLSPVFYANRCPVITTIAWQAGRLPHDDSKKRPCQYWIVVDLRDSQRPAGVFVAEFQVKRNGKVFRQPERQRWQSLADDERIGPRFKSRP